MGSEWYGWIAIPIGLTGMALATKSWWGFGLMAVANALWVAVGLCTGNAPVIVSSAIYSGLALCNAWYSRPDAFRV